MASLLLASPAEGASPDDIGELPVDVAVATDAGTPVRDAAWVDAELARAEQLFGPHGVHFRRVGLRSLDDSAAHMVTRADRDRLVSAYRPGVINVVVVGTLMDVDEAERLRFGVHWHYRPGPERRYIILSSFAPPTVLAHELGHYFGNPHSTVPDNLMSYTRTPGHEVFLDEAQVRIIRARAREILATREVVAAPGSPAPAR